MMRKAFMDQDMLLMQQQLHILHNMRRNNRRKQNDNRTLNRKRLFITNLRFEVTEAELSHHFESHGTVTDVECPKDEHGIGRGFGYCSFTDEKDALNVKEKMDGNVFRGRKLIIHFAMHKTTPSPEKNAIEVTPESKKKTPYNHHEDLPRSTSSFSQLSLKPYAGEVKVEKKKDDTLAKQDIFLPKDRLYSSFSNDCLVRRSASDSYSSPFEFGFAIPLSDSFDKLD
jgi:RNA recognition motif-containing protein